MVLEVDNATARWLTTDACRRARSSARPGLARGGVKGAETFAELELIARGLMEQGRLMATVLERSRERAS